MPFGKWLKQVHCARTWWKLILLKIFCWSITANNTIFIGGMDTNVMQYQPRIDGWELWKTDIIGNLRSSKISILQYGQNKNKCYFRKVLSSTTNRLESSIEHANFNQVYVNFLFGSRSCIVLMRFRHKFFLCMNLLSTRHDGMHVFLTRLQLPLGKYADVCDSYFRLWKILISFSKRFAFDLSTTKQKKIKLLQIFVL